MSEGLTMDALRMAVEMIPMVTGPSRIVVSPYIPRKHYADEIMEIRYSRHRSKRTWKKLCQRRRRTAVRLTRPGDAIVMGDTMFVPPEFEAAVQAELRRETQRLIQRHENALLFGGITLT